MKCLIFSQRFKSKDAEYLKLLLLRLSFQKIDYCFFSPYAEMLRVAGLIDTDVGKVESYEDLISSGVTAIISLGGDGTILKCTTLVRDSNIPIIGINLGRLGFLASVEKRNIIEAVDMLAQGMYEVKERSLLYLETNEPLFENPFSLNDFTILKRDNSSMITIHTYVNGDYMTSYWADGLIVATPTGSTAYSLSCGGPIIFPNSGNFVLTPVAPHNLSMRPIIISDSSVISFEIEGRSDTFLATLDSRFRVIKSIHQMAVRKCDFTISLIQLHNYSFIKTMNEKMNWGSDQRN